MDAQSLLINIILSLVLFFINIFLGRIKSKSKYIFGYSAFGFGDITEENFSGNFAQMIVHPAVFTAITTGLCQFSSYNTIVKDLWLVVPFYWVLRFLSICWKNLFAFTNWKLQIGTCIISVLLSEGTLFFIVKLLIEKDIDVFISVEEFKNAFWFAIIAYIAKLIWDMTKYKMVGENIFSSQTKKSVIIRRYNKFHNRYHKFIDNILKEEYFFQSNHLKAHFTCLLYSIMIYEDHNRPPWIRFFEYGIKVLFWNKNLSLGIMQVQSEVLISSKTSIAQAIKKIYPVFSESKIDNKLQNSISEYNAGDDYLDEVISIYEELRKYLELKDIGFYRIKITKYKRP